MNPPVKSKFNALAAVRLMVQSDEDDDDDDKYGKDDIIFTDSCTPSVPCGSSTGKPLKSILKPSKIYTPPEIHERNIKAEEENQPNVVSLSVTGAPKLNRGIGQLLAQLKCEPNPIKTEVQHNDGFQNTAAISIKQEPLFKSALNTVQNKELRNNSPAPNNVNELLHVDKKDSSITKINVASNDLHNIVKISGLPEEFSKNKLISFLGIWPSNGQDGIRVIRNLDGSSTGYAYVLLENHNNKMDILKANGMKFDDVFPLNMVVCKFSDMEKDWKRTCLIKMHIEGSPFVCISGLGSNTTKDHLLEELNAYHRSMEDIFYIPESSESAYVVFDSVELAVDFLKDAFCIRGRRVKTHQCHPLIVQRWCRKNNIVFALPPGNKCDLKDLSPLYGSEQEIKELLVPKRAASVRTMEKQIPKLDTAYADRIKSEPNSQAHVPNPDKQMVDPLTLERKQFRNQILNQLHDGMVLPPPVNNANRFPIFGQPFQRESRDIRQVRDRTPPMEIQRRMGMGYPRHMGPMGERWMPPREFSPGRHQSQQFVRDRSPGRGWHHPDDMTFGIGMDVMNFDHGRDPQVDLGLRRGPPRYLSPRRDFPNESSLRREHLRDLSPRRNFPRDSSPRREPPRDTGSRRDLIRDLSPNRGPPRDLRGDLSRDLSPRKRRSLSRDLGSKRRRRRSLSRHSSPRRGQPRDLSPRRRGSPSRDSLPRRGLSPRREISRDLGPKRRRSLSRHSSPRRSQPRDLSPRRRKRSLSIDSNPRRSPPRDLRRSSPSRRRAGSLGPRRDKSPSKSRYFSREERQHRDLDQRSTKLNSRESLQRRRKCSGSPKRERKPYHDLSPRRRRRYSRETSPRREHGASREKHLRERSPTRDRIIVIKKEENKNFQKKKIQLKEKSPEKKINKIIESTVKEVKPKVKKSLNNMNFMGPGHPFGPHMPPMGMGPMVMGARGPMPFMGPMMPPPNFRPRPMNMRPPMGMIRPGIPPNMRHLRPPAPGMMMSIYIRAFNIPDQASTEDIREFFAPVLPAKIAQNIGYNIYDIDFYSPADASMALQKSGMLIRKNKIQLQMLPGPPIPLPPRPFKKKKKRTSSSPPPEGKDTNSQTDSLPPKTTIKQEPTDADTVKADEEQIPVEPFPDDPFKYRLPPFDPDVPAGQCAIEPMEGFYCQLCRKFYRSRITAFSAHCKSKQHYDNLKAEMKKIKQEVS
nr:uncharacterized protein zf(matrin)-3 isoform X2 [Ciona intestinalis]|eukprot:XP_018669896.1 uncharacterized protein zf(matrin)-3 isoform X2 [Ciona intestinalis]